MWSFLALIVLAAPASAEDAPEAATSSEEPAPSGAAPETASAQPVSTPEAAPTPQALPAEPLLAEPLPAEVLHVVMDADTGPTLRVGGFADVGILGTNDLETIDFAVGQLVVHSLATMPGNFSAFAEVTVNSSPVWQTRVERMLLSWEAGDALKVSAGRYHIPVTWWNSTFHHGLWLQTSARRPLLIGYNDAFIPTHAVGVTATGRLPVLDALGLRYDVGLNGGADDHKHDGTSVEAPRLAWHGVVAVEPRALPKLRIGASSYGDPERMRDGVMVDERMHGVHLAYTGEAPELIGEWVVIDHHVMDAAHVAMEHYSYGAYVQVGWRLPFADHRFKPYLRNERIIVDASDPSLASSASQHLYNAGLRIDLSDTFALKVEGSRREFDGADGSFEGIVQASAAW